MILQALVDYYEALNRKGEIAKLGWCYAKISYALNLDTDGCLLNIFPLLTEEQRGKKVVMIPQIIELPEGEKRSSGIKAQFLWDNARYMLGIDKSGNEIRARDCFKAMGLECQKVLKYAEGNVAKALKRFFTEWKPEQAIANVALQPYLEELFSGANLTFMVEGNFAKDDIEIAKAWDKYKSEKSCENQGYCFITGEKMPIARLHPNIKGVRGAQSSGASLVSFNAEAFESYGHKQGENAYISEYAAFAYTTALNSLLADKRHTYQLGDVTIVFWSEEADEVSSDFMSSFFYDENTINDKDLESFFKLIGQGKPFGYKDGWIKPDNKFYVVGLSPNAARISVRFFFANTLEYFVNNFKRFYDDFTIVKPSFDHQERLNLWQILQETANRNSKEKMATPLLSGAFFSSVLTGNKYPNALYQNILLRVKAEQGNSKVNRIKAAIIKGCLIRNFNKEDAKMSLNEECKTTAYTLGRVFAILENLQELANPNINATIKDKYFNSACTTPAIVFPILMKLANHHLRKIIGDLALAKMLKKKMTLLLGRVQVLPKRLDLIEQGEFVLGYYHELRDRYTNKEEK